MRTKQPLGSHLKYMFQDLMKNNSEGMHFLLSRRMDGFFKSIFPGFHFQETFITDLIVEKCEGLVHKHDVDQCRIQMCFGTVLMVRAPKKMHLKKLL